MTNTPLQAITSDCSKLAELNEAATPAALREMRLIFARSENLAPARIDSKLVGLIAKAEVAYTKLTSETAIASSQKPHLVRVARLRFLAPDVVIAILERRQPPLLTARKMLRATKIPFCWKEQRALFGFE